MKLSQFARQLKYFSQHRLLFEVPKQPLKDQQKLLSLVNAAFERTQGEDNQASDYDFLPNRILKKDSDKGEMTRARYQSTGTERHLERTEVHYRERKILRAHQTPDALEVFQSYSHPNTVHSISCFRLDHKHPERSFLQELSLEPDPWLPPAAQHPWSGGNHGS